MMKYEYKVVDTKGALLQSHLNAYGKQGWMLVDHMEVMKNDEFLIIWYFIRVKGGDV